VNEQTSATTLVAGDAPAVTTPPEDAWDRLAALAFGDAASEGGCSEHAHDCTCLAAHGAAEAVGAALEADPERPLPGTEPPLPDPEPPLPDPDRPVDPEAEPPYREPDMVPPDPERPVFPDSEPEPTPPGLPGPEQEPAPDTGI
jgi:hypothetical protein